MNTTTDDLNTREMLKMMRDVKPPTRCKVFTHPTNVELLRKRLTPFDGESELLFRGIEIHANELLDKDKWTGRYVLLDGRAVESRDVAVPDGRFFEWTESDIWWLLKRCIIRKEMEPLFFFLDYKPMFDMLTVPVFNLLFSF